MDAGEAINSTMAAAGFGNLISDVAGLGLGEVIENLAKRTGLTAPKLTPEQIELPRTRFIKGVSGAVGISIGARGIVGCERALVTRVCHGEAAGRCGKVH